MKKNDTTVQKAPGAERSEQPSRLGTKEEKRRWKEEKNKEPTAKTGVKISSIPAKDGERSCS